MEKTLKTMKHQRAIAAAALIPAAAFQSQAAAGTATPDRPNIIMFLVDDLGYNDFSCYGSAFYRTPTIDSLAREGLLMTDAYAACTVSSPTRAALMSGKYPARLHLTDWINGWKCPDALMDIPKWTHYLPLEEKTMAEYLHDAGYATWHVGKWHLGDDEMYWAENQGFDINIAGNHKGSPNNDKSIGARGYFSPYGLKRLEDGPEGEYLTERLTREAVALIDNAPADRPFFLNFCHYAVHGPLGAPQDLIDKYADLVDEQYPQTNPVYAGMLEAVDKSLESVLAALSRKGILDNTLIIVTSDNGALEKNSPSLDLRAGKGSEYEGGVRIPMIFYWEGRIDPCGISDAPVISVDMLPTLLGAAGIQAPGDIDGRSFLPLLTGDARARRKEARALQSRPIFWHYPHYHRGGATPYSAVRKGGWKLIVKYETGQGELYHISKDIAETRDLSSRRPLKMRRLRRILDDHLEETGAQFPTFRNAPAGQQ